MGLKLKFGEHGTNKQMKAIYISVLLMIILCLSCKTSHKATSSGTIPIVHSSLVIYFVKLIKSDGTDGVILWKDLPGCPVAFNQKNELLRIGDHRINTNEVFRVNFIDEEFRTVNAELLNFSYQTNINNYKEVESLIPEMKK